MLPQIRAIDEIRPQCQLLYFEFLQLLDCEKGEEGRRREKGEEMRGEERRRVERREKEGEEGKMGRRKGLWNWQVKDI